MNTNIPADPQLQALYREFERRRQVKYLREHPKELAKIYFKMLFNFALWVLLIWFIFAVNKH